MREVAPGLHHWTAPHPGWDPDFEPGSPADWPEEVGCTLYEAPDAAVFIDPLVPDELWPAIDAVVAARPVAVLTTIRFHGRSRDAVLARYDGANVHHDATMPAGVDALAVDGFQETMFWLPGPAALVPGDLLIGDGEGGVRVCPESWLRGYHAARARRRGPARRAPAAAGAPGRARAALPLERGDRRRPRRARARAGLKRERAGRAGAEVEVDHDVAACGGGQRRDEPDAVALAARLVADPEAVEQRVPLLGWRGRHARGLRAREADVGELADVAALADQLDVDADLASRDRQHAVLAGVAEVEVQGRVREPRLAVLADHDLRVGVAAQDLLRARHAEPEMDLVSGPAHGPRRSPPGAPARSARRRARAASRRAARGATPR